MHVSRASGLARRSPRSPGRCWRRPSACSSRSRSPASASRSTARGAGSAPGRCSSSRPSCEARAGPLRGEAAGRAPGPPAQPAAGARRCCVVAGRGVLLVASQPDLGTALVHRLHDRGAARRRRACRCATSPSGAGRRPRRSSCSSRSASPTGAARLTAFLDPWAHAGDAGLPGGAGPDRARLRRAVRPRAGRSRCRRSSTCPRPTPTSSSPSSARSSASSASAALLSLYGLSPTPGCASPSAAKGALRQARWPPGITSLILCQARSTSSRCSAWRR